jgi:hypothetical protein
MGRLGAVAALGYLIPCLGAESADSPIGRDMRSLQENPIPVLRAEESYIQAARREGLGVPAGKTLRRRALLARVFPHLVFPDSAVEGMALSEEFVSSQCPEQRESGLALAWSKYAALAATIPDSLLPPWESLAPFLQAREMQAIPACRAKLLTRSSPGTYREECSSAKGAKDSGSEDAPEDALAWSPACLQIRSAPPGACLVAAPDGKDCQVTVTDFNSRSGDFRIPARGSLAEGRTELLRIILEQDFHRRGARLSNPGPGTVQAADIGKPGSANRDWKTPVRFQAASDSSRFASVGKPWLRAYLEDLPRELYPLRDSAAAFAAPILRATRYGYFRIAFERRDSRPTPAGGMLQEARALAQALRNERGFLEKQAKLFYARFDALYRRPDTLAYSLWLAPSPDPDTAAYRPARVVSTGILNGIDSIAWKYSLGKSPDTLLGPFPTAYGTAFLRLSGESRGEGKVPFDSAKENIRIQMARGFVLASALGLLRDQASADADLSGDSPADVPLPRFKDKEELIQAVSRLRYGPQGAGKAQLQTLAQSPRPILEEMYRMHKRESEQADWIGNLTITAEAERFGIRL